MRIIALVGGGLAALAGVVYAIVVAIKVHEFATTGSQTYAEANHLTSGAGLLGLQLVGQAAALLVAVAFVLVSLQAMNQGLLTRFMGYLGMFAGALVLFQITQVPVVQTFWLLAIAYLISGRWPTGVPPAWRSGRAEPWPSSAEMRARRAAETGDRRQRGAKKPRARRRPGARGRRRAGQRAHPGQRRPSASASAATRPAGCTRARLTPDGRRSSVPWRPFSGPARPSTDLSFARCAPLRAFASVSSTRRRRRDGSRQPAVPGGRHRPRVGSDVWPRNRMEPG